MAYVLLAVGREKQRASKQRLTSRADWLCGVAEFIAPGKEAVERGVASYLVQRSLPLSFSMSLQPW